MFERTVLPDGPRVISARLPGSRSVTIEAHVLAGSRHEGADQAGCAHFMEHLTFKGTRAYPVDAGALGGGRGDRRLVQRLHRPRVHRLLRPRPAASRGPGDGRSRRARGPPAARGARDRAGARRHRRGDPLVPRRPVGARQRPLRPCPLRRHAARPRDRRHRVERPRAAGRRDPPLLGDVLPARQRRRRGIRRPRPRRSWSSWPARRSGPATGRSPATRPPRSLPPASCSSGPRARPPRPSSSSAFPACAATIPTSGRSRS